MSFLFHLYHYTHIVVYMLCFLLVLRLYSLLVFVLVCFVVVHLYSLFLFVLVRICYECFFYFVVLTSVFLLLWCSQVIFLFSMLFIVYFRLCLSL